MVFLKVLDKQTKLIILLGLPRLEGLNHLGKHLVSALMLENLHSVLKQVGL